MLEDSPAITPDDETSESLTSEPPEAADASAAAIDEAVARAVEQVGALGCDDDDDTSEDVDADEPETVDEPEAESAAEPTPEEAAADSLWGGAEEEASEDAEAEAAAEGENPFAAAEGAVRDAHHQIRLGLAAFRDVREATQRHADAREELRIIQETLEAHANELKHRIDIEEQYPQIVAEQTAELEAARELSAASIARAEELDAERADLESRLTILKTQNEDSLRPYRNVADSTKGRADDAARALADARRQTKSAENALNDATRRRDQAISAAHRTVDNAQQRLRQIQSELNAAQSGEASEVPNETNEAAIARLQNELTSEQAHLASAEADVTSITNENRAAVEAAQQRVFDQKQLQKQAERDADAAKKEANKRRSEYERLLKKAQDSENALSDEIKQKRAEADAARKEHDDAETRIEIARERLDEAELIHATPQDTIALREQIVHEQADLDAQQDQVDELAGAERELRKGTFKQRLILIIAVAIALAIIVGIVVALVTHR